jgi:diacylglycerol O-acyltransferase / wax synthase
MAAPLTLTRRMTSLDASFLYLERPNALLHVGGIYTFAHALDYERLLRSVRDRLPLIPRYVQRVVMVPLNLGHPTWEPDPEFDIRDHIKRHTLKAPGDDSALAALCAKLFAQPLVRSKPLWEMHLISGHHGKGCAMLAKTHHCMIDGASGVELINILMDATPHPGAIEPPPQAPLRPALPNPIVQAAGGLIDTLRTQLEMSRHAAGLIAHPSRAIEEVRTTLDAVGALARALLAGAPPTPFNGQISRARALAWAPLSLNDVKAVKNRLGGTVNDVVLAVIAGGLRHYLRDRDVKVDRTELKAMVPVNVRAQHEHLKLGNRVSMMVAPLPIGITDPVERLRQVSAAMDELKSSGQAGQMERVVALTDLLPPPLQRPLARLQASVTPVNTVCTNVPGPRETRYLLAQPVRMMVPIVPLAVGIGLGFAIMSYADQLTIGLNGDAQRVGDIWKLATTLHRSFDELWAATGLERVTEARRVEPALKRRQRHPTASKPKLATPAPAELHARR